jgi:hypothetical protein
MSLYDLYYSDKNKQHMFKLLTKITNNNLEMNIFFDIMNTTFTSSNYSDLLNLNKELIEKICKYYNITEIKDNDIIYKQNNKPIEPIIDTPSLKRSHISSLNRHDGTRYHYNIEIIEDIKYIDKLIIPIEDNDIFINNNIRLIIPELNIDTICSCKETNKINNYIYGTYILEDNITTKISNKINIIIMSLYSDHNDYNELTIINGKDEDYYKVTNSNLIKLGDHIRTNMNKNYRIIDIEDNKIKLNKELDEDENEFINLNLQNIIVFSY